MPISPNFLPSARRCILALLVLALAAGCGGQNASEPATTQAELPAPKAWALSYRQRFVTGEVRGEYGSRLQTTFVAATQPLLIDLEHPEAPPIPLDADTWPLPGGNSGGVPREDFPLLVPQESTLPGDPAASQRFDRFVIYTRHQKLYIVDLAKGDRLPVPRQLSRATILSGPFFMARFDRSDPERSYVSVTTPGTVDNPGRRQMVRLDMSADDAPLDALPFDPARSQVLADGSAYIPLPMAGGVVAGGFVLTDFPDASAATGRRSRLEHRNASGEVLRRFESARIPFPYPGTGSPSTWEIHPSVAWSSLNWSVLGLPAQVSGVPGPGGFALYRPATGELILDRLPALTPEGGHGGFGVIAETPTELITIQRSPPTANDPVLIPLELWAVSTSTLRSRAIRPDFRFVRAHYLRWPYLLVLGLNAGQVFSIDLASPDHPITELYPVANFNDPPIYGLGADRLIMGSPFPQGYATAMNGASIRIRPLGEGNETVFERRRFVGWASVYDGPAFSRPTLTGRLFSEPASTSAWGWSRPDGESLGSPFQRSTLPRHFLMTDDDPAGARLTGVSADGVSTIAVGSLPATGAQSPPVWLAPGGESGRAPSPAYAGRWVVLQVPGPSRPCTTIPTQLLLTPGQVPPCVEAFSDLYLADPAVAGSLRRLTNVATQPF